MSDEMSLALTRRIENLFAKEYVGGEVQRRAAIQCAINEVISADLAAERERATEAECHISELTRELDDERQVNQTNQAAIERFRQHESELREVKDGYYNAMALWRDKFEKAETERDALRAQLDEAREALAFYANKQVYEPDSVGRSSDLTFRARAVLDKIKGGGDE